MRLPVWVRQTGFWATAADAPYTHFDTLIFLDKFDPALQLLIARKELRAAIRRRCHLSLSDTTIPGVARVNFDVIGDIHGEYDKLVALLVHLGYAESLGAWRHPSRSAIFVGDLIDRGPKQSATVELVRAMVGLSSEKLAWV